MNNKEEIKLFDALCDIAIYHFCDLRRPVTTGKSKFARSVKLIKAKGIIENRDDTGNVAYCYNQMVEEYVLQHIPEFLPQYDYWGGMCFDCNSSWRATKNGKFAGEAAGLYMLFDNSAALVEYTEERRLERLDYKCQNNHKGEAG